MTFGITFDKISHTIVLLTVFFLSQRLFTNGFSLEEYCNYFTSEIRPIVCVLKSLTSTTQSPTWNSTNSTVWDWEEDCSCELSCWPQTNFTAASSKIEEWFYTCNSCGSECPIYDQSSEQNARPRCSCALIGSSLKSTCSCTATCATFRGLFFNKQKHIYHHPHFPHPPPPPPYHHHHHHEYDHEDDDDDDDEEESSNCIFTVNRVFDGFNIHNTSEPLSCECGRSKRAEWTLMPEFVCVCQRT